MNGYLGYQKIIQKQERKKESEGRGNEETMISLVTDRYKIIEETSLWT